MECPVCKEWRPRAKWSPVQWNANGGKGSPIAIDACGWPRNCCKVCCNSDGTYYRPPAAEDAASSSAEEMPERHGDGAPRSAEKASAASGAEAEGRLRKASPLMPPQGAKRFLCLEEVQRDWDQAEGWLRSFVPVEFWSLCEEMWIDQNLKYRDILKQYNAYKGFSERKCLKKHVSYWGAMKIPDWAMPWSAPGFPGYADATNEVYAAVFRTLWPKSHICGYSSPTIGDHIEALLGWYIYWTTEHAAEFDDLVHQVVKHLNQALLSAWLLRIFDPRFR